MTFFSGVHLFERQVHVVKRTRWVIGKAGAESSNPQRRWVGIGLGSAVMDGARIFMGSIKDGTPVFSEQVGEGHSHRPAPDRAADRYALVQEGGKTTLELHVPFEKVPFVGKKVSVIAAFSGSTDLTTFHDDNHDGGTIDLSAPE
jgi:hypothetical protein